MHQNFCYRNFLLIEYSAKYSALKRQKIFLWFTTINKDGVFILLATDYGDGDSDDSSTAGVFKNSSFLPSGAPGYNMSSSAGMTGQGQGSMYMGMNGDNYTSGGDTSVRNLDRK